MSLVAGPEGLMLSEDEHRRINEAVARVFKGPAGKAVLDYLKAATLNSVSGPGVTDAALRHLEGQRFIVASLLKRIELAKERPNVSRETSDSASPGRRRRGILRRTGAIGPGASAITGSNSGFDPGPALPFDDPAR
jgi:hypothetical protein